MKKIALVPIIVLLAGLAAAEQTSILPKQFAGWTLKGAPQVSSDPAVADPSNPAVLREYSFSAVENADYSRDARTIHIKAARFADATGAYGAFTIYKTLGMQTEKIGEQAASNNNKVLFYVGNILVQADLDQVTAMSAAELRQLADALPRPSKQLANVPTLPRYLPQQSYVKHSAKYLLGPQGLSLAQSPIPASLVDFNKSPEVVLGQYSSSDGDATLVLIAYPTPQIAAERLRAFEAQKESLSAGANFDAKRTGPIVATVIGHIPASEAKSLLASVNYDANVTWSEPTFLSKRDNIGNLIVGAFTLIGFILLLALILGFAFGGVRVVAKKLFPDRVFDRPEDVEIISLHLRE